MTWLPHHLPDTNCIALRILHHYLLAVSPWDSCIAIRSLPHHGKTPLPSNVLPWKDSLSLHLLAIAVGQVPMGRLPVGKLPRNPLVACCIAVLSLCLCKKTPREENSMGRLSSHHGTLAYIVLSHFSNVQYSSRQRYPSLSLEHTRRLWWSSTLECSISFLHGNCPFNWHSRSCCIRGFTGCIPLGAAASRYNIIGYLWCYMFEILCLVV
jgi:hypothetical protein